MSSYIIRTCIVQLIPIVVFIQCIIFINLQHNGSCNAYTASDHTNYYFDISPDYLGGALDRYAFYNALNILIALK